MCVQRLGRSELTLPGRHTDKWRHTELLRALGLQRVGHSVREETVMFAHTEIARIAGIPIYLDMFFVLLLLLFSYPYFTTGNTQDMSAGFVIIVGILLSVLLHE